MFGKQSKRQTGFALLIFLVIMMGLGGIALTGFSQKVIKAVEKNRFEHNKDVLQQAKNALLMFAYNYPVTHSGQGPGRLPCPYNQIPIGAGSGYSGSISNAICEAVGRLPWGHTNLELPEFKDADGEHLWYAVSKDFNNNATPIINSDTKGTISIKDQTGNIIYDGNVSGIAAVIIAPGSAITIDDDDNGSLNYQQVRNRNDPTDPVNFESKNFLDSAYGGTALTENNFSFINPINPTDPLNGFILGPILDSNNNLLMNDQIIIIRAEEVIAMAEKATLQAYRDAIDTYQQNIWGSVSANYRYPWLDPYDSSDDLMAIPSPLPVSDPIIGRVPSIFGEYFNGSASESIKSQIEIDIQYDGVTWNEILPIADVNFNASGDLETNFSESFTKTYYTWDGHSSTPDANSPQDGVWELCAGTAGTGPNGTGNDEDDCNRKTDGTFKIPGDLNLTESDVWLEVKRITLIFNQTATFINNDLIGLPPQFEAPSGLNHALVSADYNNNSVHPDITNEIDVNFRSSFGAPAPGPAFGDNPADRIRVGIRYYPELPIWILDNLWHDKIMLAYSAALQADAVDNTCALPVLPFTVATSLTSDYCLILENSGGITNDKAALLFSAGTANPSLVDDGVPENTGFADIFEGENATPAYPYSDITFWTAYYNPVSPPPDYVRLEANLKFDRRPTNGNDVILVLEQ
jgi:hypothetical protein